VIVKTFTAPTIEKALWLLNEDLGPKAVVLKTRFNNTKNNSGKPLQFVEITAFLDSTSRGKQDNEQFDSAISINSDFQNIYSKKANDIGGSFDTAVDVEIFEVVGW
jgi:flagellar biosynthesis GTPase FlhF